MGFSGENKSGGRTWGFREEVGPGCLATKECSATFIRRESAGGIIGSYKKGGVCAYLVGRSVRWLGRDCFSKRPRRAALGGGGGIFYMNTDGWLCWCSLFKCIFVRVSTTGGIALSVSVREGFGSGRGGAEGQASVHVTYVRRPGKTYFAFLAVCLPA